MQEGRQLIQSNYGDKKIIHIIIEKFIFDNKEFDDLPDEKIECNFLNLLIVLKYLNFSSNQIFIMSVERLELSTSAL